MKRNLSILCSAIAVLMLAAAGVLYAARSLPHDPALARSRLLPWALAKLRRIERIRDGDRREVLVFFGDSIMEPVRRPAAEGGPLSVPTEVAKMFEDREAVRVVEVIKPALELLHFYFFAAALAHSAPVPIVVPINFRLLESHDAPAPRLDICAILPFAELGRALRLPLQGLGLPASTLVTCPLRRIPGVSTWSEQSDRVRLAFREAPFWGKTHAPPVGSAEYARAVMQQMRGYDAKIDDRNDQIALLKETVDVMRRHGAPVLVFVEPIPLAALARHGYAELPYLRESIATLKDVVESRAGRFVDLHDLLGAEGFRDDVGHLSPLGVRGVADALEPELMALVHRARDRSAHRGGRDEAL